MPHSDMRKVENMSQEPQCVLSDRTYNLLRQKAHKRCDYFAKAGKKVINKSEFDKQCNRVSLVVYD